MNKSDKTNFISSFEAVSKPGRMTVNEYFDEVWERVVEKRTKNNE